MNVVDLYGKEDIENYIRASGYKGTEKELNQTAEEVYNAPAADGNLICLIGRDQKGLNHKVQWVRVHRTPRK